MNNQSIKILHGISNYNETHNNHSRRLVIIYERGTALIDQVKPGPFLSFEDLTSEDFFEVYRYKKSLEISKEK